jgi:hypothetical protein
MRTEGRMMERSLVLAVDSPGEGPEVGPAEDVDRAADGDASDEGDGMALRVADDETDVDVEREVLDSDTDMGREIDKDDEGEGEEMVDDVTGLQYAGRVSRLSPDHKGEQQAVKKGISC